MFANQEKNLFGSKGPRKFQITIPAFNGSKYHEVCPVGKHDNLESLAQSKSKNVVLLVNNPPQWSEGELRRTRSLCIGFLQQSGKALGQEFPVGAGGR
jgi:hypothetical protein